MQIISITDPPAKTQEAQNQLRQAILEHVKVNDTKSVFIHHSLAHLFKGGFPISGDTTFTVQNPRRQWQFTKIYPDGRSERRGDLFKSSILRPTTKTVTGMHQGRVVSQPHSTLGASQGTTELMRGITQPTALPRVKNRQEYLNAEDLAQSGVDLAQIQLLTMKDLQRLTRLGKSYLYEAVSLGAFPKPLKFGSSRRSTARWFATDIKAWIECRKVSESASSMQKLIAA